MDTDRFVNCGEPLSEEELREVEQRLGHEIPSDLRSRFLVCNGGRPRKNIYIDDEGNDHEVHSFMNAGIKQPGAAPLMEETVERLVHRKHLIPGNFLPFARNSGGDVYCLDRDTQSVYFWAADHADDPERAFDRIASSLAEFIEGMVTEDEAYG